MKKGVAHQGASQQLQMLPSLIFVFEFLFSRIRVYPCPSAVKGIFVFGIRLLVAAARQSTGS
jgi:hypothetical protein